MITIVSAIPRSLHLAKEGREMADVVNLRRAVRASTELLGAAAPSPRTVRRVRANADAIHALLERVEGDRETYGIEDDELLIMQRKLALLREFVEQNARLEAPEAAKPPVAAAAAAMAAPAERDMTGPSGRREEGARQRRPPVASREATQEARPASNNDGDSEARKREALFGSAAAAATSFSDFMATRGSGAVEEQLKRAQAEKDSAAEDLSPLFQQLKTMLMDANDVVVRGTKDLDSVNEKIDQNVQNMSGMMRRLEDTIATSSGNCKMCTAGVLFVLALWVLAYLVMRIFPKAK